MPASDHEQVERSREKRGDRKTRGNVAALIYVSTFGPLAYNRKGLSSLAIDYQIACFRTLGTITETGSAMSHTRAHTHTNTHTLAIRKGRGRGARKSPAFGASGRERKRARKSRRQNRKKKKYNFKPILGPAVAKRKECA